MCKLPLGTVPSREFLSFNLWNAKLKDSEAWAGGAGQTYQRNPRPRSAWKPRSRSPLGVWGTSSCTRGSPSSTQRPVCRKPSPWRRGSAASSESSSSWTQRAHSLPGVLSAHGATGVRDWPGQMRQGLGWPKSVGRGCIPRLHPLPSLSVVSCRVCLAALAASDNVVKVVARPAEGDPCPVHSTSAVQCLSLKTATTDTKGQVNSRFLGVTCLAAGVAMSKQITISRALPGQANWPHPSSVWELFTERWEILLQNNLGQWFSRAWTWDPGASA